MKKIVYTALLLWVCILPLRSYAQVNAHTPISTEYLIGTYIAVDATLENKADIFPGTVPPTDLTWHQGFSPEKSSGRVSLEVSDDNNECLPDTFSCTIVVELTSYNWGSLTSTVNYDTLTVNYNKAAGEKFKEKDIVQYDDIYYMNVKVISISNTSVKQYLFIKNEIEQERYKEMIYTHNPEISSITYSATDNAYTLNFNIPAEISAVAVEYDVEWSFIESYDPNGFLDHRVSHPYDFRFNSTRVTIQKLIGVTPSIQISNIYDRGFLICRIRAVSRGGNLHQQRIEGLWSLADNGTIPATSGGMSFPPEIPDGSSDYKMGYRIGEEHDRMLNWQYECVYAEEAKRKESINYFDGSLRSRQTQTLVKSETPNYIIIQDKIYDYEGRAAIQTLPTPVDQQALKYIVKSVKNLSGGEYTKVEFDHSGGSLCFAETERFGSGSKSEIYYSAQNQWALANVSSTNFNNYTPVSAGYPFIQTEFTPDNTGRVSRTSAPGQQYQLGTNHEIKYSYVTPNQTELDVLFGSEIGYAEHYKKNIVRDANGQVSVSYLNASGKVIATALSGPSPEGMEMLERPVIPIAVDLMNSTNSSYLNGALVSTYTFEVTEESDYDFMYSMNAAKYIPEVCSTGEEICFDGVYDLTISLTNECSFEQLKGEGASEPKQLIHRTIGNKADASGSTECETETVLYEFETDTRLISNGDGYITQRLLPGTYTITKKLTIDEAVIDLYTEKFLALNATCKTLADFQEEALANIDTSACGLTCEQCTTRLGTFADYRLRKVEELTNIGVTEPTEADEERIAKGYADQLAFCDDLCDTEFDMCDAIEELLIGDVSPGGQYAEYAINETTGAYEVTSDEYNFLKDNSSDVRSYRNGSNYPEFNNLETISVLIDGIPTKVKDLTAEQFIENFDPEWAKIMIRNHPEYCQLKRCRDEASMGKQSSEFDMKMLNTYSYDDAVTEDLVNPFDINNSDPSAFTYPLPDLSDVNVVKDPYFQSTGCGATTGREAMWERLEVYKTYSFSTPFLMNDEGEDVLVEIPGSGGKFQYLNTTVYAGIKCPADPTKMCEADPVTGNIIAGPVELGTIVNGPQVWSKKVELTTPTTPVDLKFSMWEIPVITYFCSHIDDNAKRLKHCVTENRDKIKTCAGVKDRYWHMFRALYLANKNYLMTLSYTNGSENCICNPTVHSSKKRRIFPNEAENNESLLQQDPQSYNPGPSVIDDLMDDAQDRMDDACQSQCEAYADYWMDQLGECNLSKTGSPSQWDNVRADLIAVCVKGCDADNPMGSSSVSQAKKGSAVDTTFRRVLQRHGVFNLQTCNDIVITMPMPYGHNYFSTQNPKGGDTCACNEGYNDIAPGITDTISTTDTEGCPCEDVLKDADVKMVMNIQTGLDPKYKCKDCINCGQFAGVYYYFQQEYVSVPTSAPQFRQLFTGYFNRKLSFNLSFIDYARFAAECLGDTTPLDPDAVLSRYRTFMQVNNLFRPAAHSEYDLSPYPSFALPTRDIAFGNGRSEHPDNSVMREENSLAGILLDQGDACVTYPPRYGAMFNSQTGPSFESVKNLLLKEAIFAKMAAPAPPPPSVAGETFLDECGCNKMLVLYEEDPDNFYEEMDNIGLTKTPSEWDVYINRCKTVFVAGGGDWTTGTYDANEDQPEWHPGAKWREHTNHLFYISHQSDPLYIPYELSCVVEAEVPEHVNTIDCEIVMEELKAFYENTDNAPYFETGNSYTTFFTQLYSHPGNPAFLKSLIDELNARLPDIASYSFSEADLYMRISGCFEPVPCNSFNQVMTTFINGRSTLDLSGLSVKEQLLGEDHLPDLIAALNEAFNRYPYFKTFNEEIIRKQIGDCAINFCGSFVSHVDQFMLDNSITIDPGVSQREELSTSYKDDLIAYLNGISNNAPYYYFFDDASLQDAFETCTEDFCEEFRTTVKDFIVNNEEINPREPLLEQILESGTLKTALFDQLNTLGNLSPYFVFFDEGSPAAFEDHLEKCALKLPCDSIHDIAERFMTQYQSAFDNVYLPFTTQIGSPGKEGLLAILSARINAESMLFPYHDVYDRKQILSLLQECAGSCCIAYSDYSWADEFLNSLLDKNPAAPLNAYSPYTTLLTSTFWKVPTKAPVYMANNLYDYIDRQSLRYVIDHLSRTKIDARIYNRGVDKDFKMGMEVTFDASDLEFSWMWVTGFSEITITQNAADCGDEFEFEVTVSYRAFNNPLDIKTKVATGYMSAFPFIRTKECSFTGTMPFLCNRSINEPVEAESCVEELKKLAMMNAENNYITYITEIREKFRASYLEACKNASEQFRLRYYSTEHHFTLYYYDQAGNLVATVPPEGVDLVTSYSDQQDILTARDNGTLSSFNPDHKLVTTYLYNSLNQLISQNTPDAGQSDFYYDDLGRIVFSRNARQAASQRYSYTYYDDLGRITEVGQLVTTATMDHTKSRSSALTATFIGSATTFEEITRTRYDDATGITGLPYPLENVRNRVVATSYLQLSSVEYTHAAYYSYDIHGNVQRLTRHIDALDKPADWIDQGYKNVEYEYDLISGKVNTVVYQRDKADQYIHEYLYDAENRITEARTGTRFETVETDATYYYYPHGPLARTELGSKKVQGLDYAYTLHGWLKGVNSGTLRPERDMGRDGTASTLHQNVGRDVYGFNLQYYEDDYAPVTAVTSDASFLVKTQGSVAGNATTNLFNGNIKMMVTAIGKFMEGAEDPPLVSAYTYDQLNRLRKAVYYNNVEMDDEEEDANALKTTGTALDDYENTFTYDANGNIKTQKRNGTSAYGTGMDELTYVYDPVDKNRLIKVSDNASNVNGYLDDIKNQTDDINYEYDNIGNLVKDKAEEIANIEWTVYGKIKRITRTAGSLRPDLEFEYTPDGHRAVKIVTPKQGEKHKKYTYYVRDAQGNILATYERMINKIVDFDTLEYAAVNDSIIGACNLDAFAVFTSIVHTSYLTNTDFNDYLESRVDSILQRMKDFLYANHPNELLLDNPALYEQTLDGYNTIDFLEAVINEGVVSDGTLIRKICECMDDDPTSFLRWTIDNPDGREYFFRALYLDNPTHFGSIMSALSCPASLSPSAFSCLASKTTSQVMAQLFSRGYEGCTAAFTNVYQQMYSSYNTQFFSILSTLPDVKKMIGSYGGYNCTSIDKDNLITAFSGNDMWDLMMANATPASLVNWFRLNLPEKFISTIAAQHKDYISDYQESHNMYSSSGNGMKAYFDHVLTYYSQSFYDNLVMKFYNKSKAFSDSLNLNEWMIYGSSRLGSNRAELNLVTIKFYADTTAGGQTINPDYITTYEPDVDPNSSAMWRGIRQYELSNHLGNVLAVITDKKIYDCTNEHYMADMIQATDYSPFGAPLPERTWNRRIIINNQFSFTTEGWTALSGSPAVTNDNGRLKITASATCAVQKEITTEPGKVYELVFDVDEGTFADMKVGVYESSETGYAQNKLYTTTYNGKHVVYFKAVTSQMFIRLMPQSGGGGSQSSYFNFVKLRRVSETAFAHHFMYDMSPKIDSRTGNTPDKYIATESITFEVGFESGSGDVFETQIETMLLANDGNEDDDYRFAFNGKERDDETYGAGNAYDYGFRIYNPRIGRFLSVDPLTKNFAMLTPYQFAANTPIRAIDLDGLEAAEVGKHNPFLVIVVLGRNGGPYGDDIENGNTQYQNLPEHRQQDDGLSLLGQLQTGATVVTFTGSDDQQTVDDIHQTIKNYRTTNPEGKIALVGHSLGGANVMDAALAVNNDKDIKNKTIDLVMVMEPTSVQNNTGSPSTEVLGSNVKSMITYSAFSSQWKGGSAEPSDPSQNVGNFTLGKGTDHRNMDNTLLPAVGAILKTLGNGVNPVKAANAIDYKKLPIYNNGDRKPGANGGTSN